VGHRLFDWTYRRLLPLVVNHVLTAARAAYAAGGCLTIASLQLSGIEVEL
jgi:hypothetical protein